MESEDIAVEADGGVVVGGGHDEVAEAEFVGDELGAVLGGDLGVVEQRAVEDLEDLAAGVGKGDGAVDLDGLRLVVGEVAVGDAVFGEGGADAVEGDLVAHLPADGGEVVLLGAAQRDAAGALVEAQVEGVVVAAGAHAQVQHVVGEGSPAVEVGGVDPEVAEGSDVAHGVSFR